MLVDAPDVQLSAVEFTKYTITEPGVLDCQQKRQKTKYELCPVSYGNSEKVSIVEMRDVPV